MDDLEVCHGHGLSRGVPSGHIRGNKIVCIPERNLADSPTQIEGVGLRARVLVPKPQASKQTDLRLQPPKRGRSRFEIAFNPNVKRELVARSWRDPELLHVSFHILASLSIDRIYIVYDYEASMGKQISKPAPGGARKASGKPPWPVCDGLHSGVFSSQQGHLIFCIGWPHHPSLWSIGVLGLLGCRCFSGLVGWCMV